MKPQDVDTGFTATLRRIEAARDVIEQGVPFGDERRYSLQSAEARGYTSRLENAVSSGLELTGDEARAFEFLLLVNAATQIIAVFYDGRAFIPNELLSLKGPVP